MPKTIQRRWINKIAEIREAAKFCEQWDTETGDKRMTDPATAWQQFEEFERAQLTAYEFPKRWIIRRGTLRFTLTAEDPTTKPTGPVAKRPRQERQEDHQAPAGPRSLFPAGFDEQTQESAEQIADQARAAGLDIVPGPTAAAVAARRVKALRLSGLSHDDIRARFTAELHDAQEKEDAEGVVQARLFLATHSGMLADMARLAAKEKPEPAAVACWCGEDPCPMPGQHKSAAAVCDAMNANQDTAVLVARAAAEPEAAPVEERPDVVAPATPGVLPPCEEGYAPVRGAKPYAVRMIHAALERAGVAVKGDEEFWLNISPAADGETVSVSVLDFGGPKSAKARYKEDRRQLRAAEVTVALIREGMTDAVALRCGVRVRVPRIKPRGSVRAATVVAVGEADYSGDKFIEWPVSLPQYPSVTGWTMRKPWGHAYMGPMWPYMVHRDGTVIGQHAKTEKEAAEALCHLFGLLSPVRLTRG